MKFGAIKLILLMSDNTDFDANLARTTCTLLSAKRSFALIETKTTMDSYAAAAEEYVKLVSNGAVIVNYNCTVNDFIYHVVMKCSWSYWFHAASLEREYAGYLLYSPADKSYFNPIVIVGGPTSVELPTNFQYYPITIHTHPTVCQPSVADWSNIVKGYHIVVTTAGLYIYYMPDLPAEYRNVLMHILRSLILPNGGIHIADDWSNPFFKLWFLPKNQLGL